MKLLFVFLAVVICHSTFAEIDQKTIREYRLKEIDENFKYFFGLTENTTSVDFANECDSSALASLRKEGAYWVINQEKYLAEFTIMGASRIMFTAKELPYDAEDSDKEVIYVVSSKDGKARWTTDRPRFFAEIKETSENCEILRYTQVVK